MRRRSWRRSQKLAAVAASAAALAGGGTAIDEFANHHGPPQAAQLQEQHQQQAERPATEAPTDPSLAVDSSLCPATGHEHRAGTGAAARADPQAGVAGRSQW